MSETQDGPASAGTETTDDTDPESTGKPSLFSRLFGRAVPESDIEAGTASAAESLRARDMLVNLRNLRIMRVDDVSVPRADIVAVPDDASIETLLDVFQRNTFSRLPVYHEALDQPVGLIHLKDLALKYGFGAPTEDFDLKSLLRPLLYAPPSMRIGVLLHKMQTSRGHMALVIDEYGGVDGLVTIEDLLEQIVGDISDEHDQDESELWVAEAPGVYLVQARMDLDDFEEVAGLHIAHPDHDEEIETLGGLVFRLSGRVPARGEIVIHEDGHEFEVVDADARRIKRLRVRLRDAERSAPAVEAAE